MNNRFLRETDPEVRNILDSMLKKDPKHRISAKKALDMLDVIDKSRAYKKENALVPPNSMYVTVGSWRANKNKSVDSRVNRGGNNLRGTPNMDATNKDYFKNMAADKQEDNNLRSDYGRRPKKLEKSRETRTNQGTRQRDIKFSPYIDNPPTPDAPKAPSLVKPKKKKVDDIVNRLYNSTNKKQRKS